MLGRQTRRYKEQDPVNIKASELVGHLHDAIAASGYTGHRLEVFLTRIVFCLFADDTGIFEPKDILWDLLEQRTARGGSDMAGWLSSLFDVLNTPEDRRQHALDPDLARFPISTGRCSPNTSRRPISTGRCATPCWKRPRSTGRRFRPRSSARCSSR
jgi:hypothetical protein